MAALELAISGLLIKYTIPEENRTKDALDLLYSGGLLPTKFASVKYLVDLLAAGHNYSCVQESTEHFEKCSDENRPERRFVLMNDDSSSRQCQPLISLLNIFEHLEELQNGGAISIAQSFLEIVQNDKTGNVRMCIKDLLLRVGDLSNAKTVLWGSKSLSELSLNEPCSHAPEIEIAYMQLEEARARTQTWLELDGAVDTGDQDFCEQVCQFKRLITDLFSKLNQTVEQFLSLVIPFKESSRFPFACAGIQPHVFEIREYSQDAICQLKAMITWVTLDTIRSTAEACHVFASMFWEPQNTSSRRMINRDNGNAMLTITNSILQGFCKSLMRFMDNRAWQSCIATFIVGRLATIGLKASDFSAMQWAIQGPAPSLSELRQNTTEICVQNGTVLVDRVTGCERDSAFLVAHMCRHHAFSKLKCRLQATKANYKFASRLLKSYRWMYAAELETVAGRYQNVKQTEDSAARDQEAPLHANVNALMQATFDLIKAHGAVETVEKDLFTLEESIINTFRSLMTKDGTASLLHQFSTVVNKRREASKKWSSMSVHLSGVSNSLAHFEMFRLRTEHRKKFQDECISLIYSYQQAANRLNSARQKTASLESTLPRGLKSYAPNGLVTYSWLNHRLKLLPEAFRTAQQKVTHKQAAVINDQNILNGYMEPVVNSYSSFSELLRCLRPLLQPLIAGGDTSIRQLKQDVDQWCKEMKDLLYTAHIMGTIATGSITACLLHATSTALSSCTKDWKNRTATPVSVVRKEKLASLIYFVQREWSVLQAEGKKISTQELALPVMSHRSFQSEYIQNHPDRKQLEDAVRNPDKGGHCTNKHNTKTPSPAVCAAALSSDTLEQGVSTDFEIDDDAPLVVQLLLNDTRVQPSDLGLAAIRLQDRILKLQYVMNSVGVDDNAADEGQDDNQISDIASFTNESQTDGKIIDVSTKSSLLFQRESLPKGDVRASRVATGTRSSEVQDKNRVQDNDVQARRNVYAVKVWRRVKAKLENQVGAEASQSLDESEHVGRLIKAATATDNLASIYEGWASWI